MAFTVGQRVALLVGLGSDPQATGVVVQASPIRALVSFDGWGTSPVEFRQAVAPSWVRDQAAADGQPLPPVRWVAKGWDWDSPEIQPV